MMHVVWRTGITLLVLTLLAHAAVAADKLPTDARIKTGTLENGVKWMWRQHDNPPDRMAIWVHVDTGSLNETEQQRGIAHFIEHMGFNGTEHFAPGELIPYFESIGMSFGPDVNAHTGFDHTAYKLYLPDTTQTRFDTGLKVLSDYTFRMLMLPDEIEKERGVILQELNLGRGPQQRIRDQFIEQVFDGTRLAKRLPIGTEERIKNMQQEDFLDYYRTWYRPDRVTVMVVADAEPEPYIPLLEKWFGEYKAPVPDRESQDPELTPFGQERAFVFTDPEWSTGDVEFVSIKPGRPPTTTVDQYRTEMVERVGSWIIGRRFSERIKKGDATYKSANAYAADFMGDAVLVQASATGEPEDWEQMLEELITEVNRAAEHGFTEREFELAKKELTAEAERAVKTEDTRNARGMVAEMNFLVNDEEPLMSAQQKLDLLEKLLPTIKLAEVNRAFADNFADASSAYVVTLPEKEEVTAPETDTVLAAARAAQARKTEPIVEEERETELLAAEPTPGELVASQEIEDLGITSGWLSNGVRIHHRFMDYKKDTVMLGIVMAGGQIEETKENVGVTTIASLIFEQPATHRLTSSDVEDIMTGVNISLSGGASDDVFAVTLQGSPEDLETGLKLAHALLTDGKLEESKFENFKSTTAQRYEMASKNPMFVGQKALVSVLMADDPRAVLLMSPELLAQQSVERSQAWFKRLTREAPIEVAVVGEITFEDALPLVEKYIGSLSERPRHADHLDPLRKLDRQPGPYKRHEEIETITPQALALVGFLSCEGNNVHDRRALQVAARVLDSKLVKRVREELGLAYVAGAQAVPSQAYEDAGPFVGYAPCAPDKVAQVIDEMNKILADFAENGPTDEELANAKKQILNDLDTTIKEPSFWFGQLQTFDLRGRTFDELRDIAAAYEALTADDVRATFAKYRTPARQFVVSASAKVAAPEPAEESEAAAESPAGAMR